MSTAIGVFRVDLNGCLSVRLTFCLNFRFEIAKTVLRFDIPALSRSKRPFSTSGVHTMTPAAVGPPGNVLMPRQIVRQAAAEALYHGYLLTLRSEAESD